jgi:hypothetical protein
MNYTAPNLTQHPPRSPRVRLAGFVLLPRMLDKCRAELVGRNGEYHYDCPSDQQFFAFTGINAGALRDQVAAGHGDWAIAEWVLAQARPTRSAHEIVAWSTWMEHRGPDNPEDREWFNGEHQRIGTQRTDIVTYFDLLDADDFVSFGGKA